MSNMPKDTRSEVRSVRKGEQRDLVEAGSGRSILLKEVEKQESDNGELKAHKMLGTDSHRTSVHDLIVSDREEVKKPTCLNGKDINDGAMNSKDCHVEAKPKGPKVGEWNPMHTRVFDVYINDASQNSRKLPDIFQYQSSNPSSSVKMETILGQEQKNANVGQKRRESLPSTNELINTGTGRKVSLPSAGGAVYKNQSPLNNNAQGLTLSLEQRIASNQDIALNSNNNMRKDSHSVPTPMSTMLSCNSALANGLVSNDKWPPYVESAFITSLQMIMKNGTAKIKLKDKNYGRNELISMYIRKKTGEKRSKKQISSHIQVWKKSISNKLQNGIQTSSFEAELLRLIECGAEQTAENWQTFENTFNRILDGDDAATDRSSISKNRSSISLPIGNQDGLAKPQAQQYANMQLPPSMYLPPGANVPMLPYHIPMVKEPATPLEYAQELYGNLKSFKCVPVNPYEQYYPFSYTHTMPQNMVHTIPTPVPTASLHPVHVPLQPGNISGTAQTPLSAPETSQHMYQAAKEVEHQQKKLIEELYNKQGNSMHSQHPYSQYTLPLSGPVSNNFSDSAIRRHTLLPPASQLGSSQPSFKH